MAKVVRLEVSVKRWADVTVTVPDDFDERLLHRWDWRDAVRKACDELDAEFHDDHDEEPEVEQAFVVPAGPEAEQELRDFRHIDLAALVPEKFAAEAGK